MSDKKQLADRDLQRAFRTQSTARAKASGTNELSQLNNKACLKYKIQSERGMRSKKWQEGEPQGPISHVRTVDFMLNEIKSHREL